MKTSDLKLSEVRAAAAGLDSYIKNVLGYDKEVKVELQAHPDKFQFWIRAVDSFVTDYSMFTHLTEIEYQAEFAPALDGVYEELSRCMRRDERELRHAMEKLGRAVEGSKEYTTEYGKLVAKRIEGAMEATGRNLLTYQRSKQGRELGDGELTETELRAQEQALASMAGPQLRVVNDDKIPF